MKIDNNKEIDVELEELKSESSESEKIGEVCDADTATGIILKIQNRPDNLRLGQPLIIDTDKLLYYTLIQRIYYPINPVAEKFANSPFTGLIPPNQIEGVRGKEFYGLADLGCLKVISYKSKAELEYQEIMREFDTIPPIFSVGRQVSAEEIKLIYKTSETTDSVGTLRGFTFEIPIDFEMLVKKPFGLFGRTGIGKSILNKLLCLFILKHQVSQLLLFDMQGEYGLYSRADKSKGLKFYFADKIQIYRLGALKKGEKSIDDAEPFLIYKDQINSEDIIASSQDLKEPSINTLFKIENLINNGTINYDNLFDAINGIDPDEHDINLFSLKALQNRIIPFEKYTFLKDRKENKREDSLENIFSKLTEGKSIVIDFGTFGTNKHLYYFIANSITRRLYGMYSQKEEESELPPLVIVVEEAHKFLKPSVINYTIFDRIAREMRKFQLTLAFVDQRPSQIDDEVFSQIANRFIMNLTDEKDIDKVVKNLPNSKNWRGVIVGLLKQQFFMYGDAIAVPSIIEVMDYNNEKLLKTKLGLEKTLAETINEIENTDVTKIFSDKEEDK